MPPPTAPLLLPLLLLLLLPLTSCITCPTNCSCQTATFSCQVCLQYYLQVYSLESKGCQCLPGFILTDQVIDYCHPFNCKKPNDWGCATCYPHAYIKYDETYQYYNCSCHPNYYLNLSSYLCRCMSHKEPTKYFEDTVLDGCYSCPEGCVCTEKGCVECRSDLFREIAGSTEYSATCHCKYPHKEINGKCQCAVDCLCYPNGTTICLETSNRMLILDRWVCKHPYTQISGRCSCQSPYYLTQTLGYSSCVCKSKINYTNYYEANGNCYECGINCTCDYTGCVSCFDGSVYINYQACICNDRYHFDGQDCLCIDPYEVYVDPVTQGVECKCMAYRIAGIYEYEGFCAKCPAGCNCNAAGCFGCADPLRVYRNISEKFQVCQCGENSNDLEGACRCNSYYVWNAEARKCQCKNIPSQLWYDSDVSVCHLCPMGCSCNSTGCHTCLPTASRTITTNSKNIKTCYCLPPFTQSSSNLCLCPKGYTKLNDTTCSCTSPYYLNPTTNLCSCSSDLNTSLYYYDDFEDTCKSCPPGCICNISGCIDCGSDFLRTIKYSLKTFKYRCPCLQNTFLVGDYCTVCNNNSYSQYLGNLKNISCVKCIQCLTCNRYGCTSCHEDMDLVDQSCVCRNSSLINLDGQCTCPLQQYLSGGVCYPCPLKCNSCIEINKTVSCTSCAFGVWRQNLPAEGCPCENRYKESSTPAAYCCPIECQECSSSGCLTCPTHTFRTLIDNACVCTNGFVQKNVTVYQDGLVCLCPNNSYLLNNECFKCPIECQTCNYNASKQMVTCLSCRPNVNRQPKDLFCKCLENYSETSYFKSEFCYATYCTEEVITCLTCDQPWNKTTNFSYCVCQTGYWINPEGNCVKCDISGCLQCVSQLTCVKCNQTENYYLVQTFCSKVEIFDFLAVQTTDENIIIQCPLEGNTYLNLVEIAVSLNQVMKPYPPKIEQQVQFEVINKTLLNQGKLLAVTLKTLNRTFHDVIISFVLEVDNDTQVGTTTTPTPSNNPIIVSQGGSTSIKQNLKMTTIYSQGSFSVLEHMQRIGLYFLVILVLIVSFYFYICGIKHNQACYFMQTMSLASFSIHDLELSTSMFLYNLRYSYYNFSPNNALSSIVPQYYLQQSKGNFKYLSVDANIVRNIGIPLILALIVAIISLTFRGLYEITRMRTLIQPAGLSIFYKKLIYRAIEFFYKTLMYPLIFFSIQSLINYNTPVYIHESFRRKSTTLSIIILSLYLLITLYQYFIELISNFNKLENLKQFLNCVFGSLIIIGSESHPKVFLLFIIIFVTTELPYFRFKMQDLWVYKVTNIVRAVIVALEIICVVLVVVVEGGALIGMFCVTVVVQMGLMVGKEVVDKHYNMISKLTSFGLNEEQEAGEGDGGGGQCRGEGDTVQDGCVRGRGENKQMI